MTKPRISVIIPAYNAELFIAEAINSIILQTVQAEIIVVNDCSTDHTLSIVQKMTKNYPTQIINNSTNLQMSESRKLAYQQASGDYVVFMDSDDYYTDRDFFCRAITTMDEHPNIGAYIGSTTTIYNGVRGKKHDLGGEGIIPNQDYLNHFMELYAKPHSSLTAILKKEYLDDLDFSHTKMMNDTIIYLYGIFNHDVYLDNQVVADYRLHQENNSNKKYHLDFIMNHLIEKQHLYQLAKRNNQLTHPKEWQYNQIVPTIQHFCGNSKSFRNSFIMTIWVIIHLESNRKKVIREIIWR